ncbi:MAG: hypothetical protein ACK4IT_04740 [Thioalkalivibrionaceae bacterium]
MTPAPENPAVLPARTARLIHRRHPEAIARPAAQQRLAPSDDIEA